MKKKMMRVGGGIGGLVIPQGTHRVTAVINAAILSSRLCLLREHK